MATPEPTTEPEATSEHYWGKGEPEPTAEWISTQDTFIMYGVFIFALAVFCVALLILFIKLRKT